MITFDKENRIFHLQTPNSSYVLGINGEFITHLYYGKRLYSIEGLEIPKELDVDFSTHACENVDLPPRIVPDVYRQDYSFFGGCDLRKPAFHAQYADGSRITKMHYLSHNLFPGKPKLPGLPATYTHQDRDADTLEITLQDTLTGLCLILRYTAFNTCDAIARSITVQNNGSTAVNLQSVLSFSMDFNRDDFDFVNLSGAWARERHIERRPLGSGTTKVESRRGASSHHQSPFFALCDHNATEDTGEVYGYSLVYSGNFEAGAEVDTFGQTRTFMGINSFDFNWHLAPGETFHAPEAILVYSDRGFGEMSRQFHSLYQTQLARGKYRDLERPILINNWEATYYDFNEEKILALAKAAKKAGIEMLVLDDGWYGKRNSDSGSLGDWYANRAKLPNGIPALAHRLNDLGMRFGLWVEPEMVSPDSDLYRAHPDWCLHVKDRPRYLGRNQLILDLSRKEVCDYILSFLTELLSNAPISYIKWDMNRNMACVGSATLPPERQGEVSHRYMLGLYEILEKITTAFPDVLFEGCSGGGGRFDAGMMYYFNQYWTSDDTDAIERMYIQYGTSYVMPSAFCAAHVSAVPNLQTNRSTPLKSRGHVAMGGQLGYELDVTKMSDKELEEISRQITEYKSLQRIIHNGDFYRTASPYETNHCGWNFVTKDHSAAVLFFFTVHYIPSTLPVYAKFKGLDPAGIYRLQSSEKTFSGSVLMQIGLKTEHRQDGESSLFVVEKI